DPIRQGVASSAPGGRPAEQPRSSRAQQGAPLRHSPLAGARVVLGVTGSIAAYKAVALASALTQAQAVVDVILTREATELVRPLSFQAITHRPALTEMFSLLAETEIGHVTLGHEADIVVVAPATAHTL